MIGINAKGCITNTGPFGQLGWPEILQESSKILRFLDVSGQEKYAKSMVNNSLY